MRPAKPLAAKLAAALNLTPEVFEKWLESETSADLGLCTLGARKVFHQGRPQSTLRLLVELASGRPLRADERMSQKLCPTVGCLNPRHYRAKLYQTWQQRVGLDQPSAAATAALIAEAFDPAVVDAMNFNDVCDLVASAEGGRHRSATDLHAQWPMYELDLFYKALNHLRSEAE